MKDGHRYGFQSYLNLEFPSQLIIDVTELCNMSCIHCPQVDFAKSGLFRGRHLNPDLHKKLIDEIACDGDSHCKYLRYTAQGETLLHPNFIEMILYASAHAKVPVNITTNGMLLKEDMAKKLVEAGVDVIDISIDANTAETYALIRRKGDFDTVRTNVLNLIKSIKTGGHKTRVVVSFVEQAQNKHESADFKKFWDDSGADHVVIRRLHSAGGLKKELVQVNKDRYPCLYPWERLTLGPDGFIHFCPQDWTHGSVICDFKESTIKEIWQGAFMEKLRNAHLSNDFSKHDFCRQCPDWSTTRWPDEGRSYSNLMQDIAFTDRKQEGIKKL